MVTRAATTPFAGTPMGGAQAVSARDLRAARLRADRVAAIVKVAHVRLYHSRMLFARAYPGGAQALFRTVTAVDVNNIGAIKTKHEIPNALPTCHTPRRAAIWAVVTERQPEIATSPGPPRACDQLSAPLPQPWPPPQTAHEPVRDLLVNRQGRRPPAGAGPRREGYVRLGPSSAPFDLCHRRRSACAFPCNRRGSFHES